MTAAAQEAQRLVTTEENWVEIFSSRELSWDSGDGSSVQKVGWARTPEVLRSFSSCVDVASCSEGDTLVPNLLTGAGIGVGMWNPPESLEALLHTLCTQA